jgi:starch synthase
VAKILMVTAEATPFAKTGGLGEVLEYLPRALAEAGEQVGVVMPLYRTAAVSNPRLVYERLQFALGMHRYSADILEQLEDGVRYFFVRLPELYDRDQLYAEQDTDYPDNHLRFAALCQAALGVARHVFSPDVIHCHDWQSALLPVLLKHVYSLHPAYLHINTILTIHNLGYQGVFDRELFDDLGLPQRLFRPELLELDGKANFLKGGLISSDVLTTVSPRYAEEIQTPQFGLGLDAVLRSRKDALIGILNGVDYAAWDPASDPQIAENFDAEHLAGKRACKKALLAEAELAEDRIDKPLIGIISRLAEQKGFDLLMEIRDELAAEDLSLVVHGSGEQRFEEFFREFAAEHPEKTALAIGYQDDLARRIQAGSDMMLMPSWYEPCGLIQMYSMRYGTLPIARATGGLDDTVSKETGFMFAGEAATDLLTCLRKALSVYGTPRWSEMIQAAMRQEFSWTAAAAEYSELYRRLTAGENSGFVPRLT